jgi:ADP-ribosylglycohydrolase
MTSRSSIPNLLRISSRHLRLLSSVTGRVVGALRAVNLGDDADTTGAIYGQLAGAFYGVNAIPKDWMERLARREFIAEKADALFDLSTA